MVKNIKTQTQKTRDKILAQRGVGTSTNIGKKLTPYHRDSSKTPLMLLIEARLGVPIEDILWSEPQRQLARKLGVHESCLSKWKKKLLSKEVTTC